MALRTLTGAVAGVVGAGRSRAREVEVHSTTLELFALTSLERSGSGLRVGEIDVAEATAAAALFIGDDPGGNEISLVGEGVVENLVGDSPSQAANEKGGTLLAVLRPGLLGRDHRVVQCLALLGWLFSSFGLFFFLFLIGVGVGRVVR